MTIYITVVALFWVIVVAFLCGVLFGMFRLSVNWKRRWEDDDDDAAPARKRGK